MYYGQNYLIYPSAFPPGSRTGEIVFSAGLQQLTSAEDVPVPSTFGLPYEDLELKTSDGISLRCYLLPQSKHLPKKMHNATPVPGEDDMTEDEVRVHVPVAGLPLIGVLVYIKSAYCHDVPRKRRESRPPHPSGQSLLSQNAVQCPDGVV